MLTSKKSLIDDRRRAGQRRIQKEKIAAVMEEVRTNATKAQNLITKAMSGTVSLESLIGGDKEKKKKGKRTMRSTSDILGDTGVSQDGMEAQGFDTATSCLRDGTDGDDKAL